MDGNLNDLSIMTITITSGIKVKIYTRIIFHTCPLESSHAFRIVAVGEEIAVAGNNKVNRIVKTQAANSKKIYKHSPNNLKGVPTICA
jgi:hypothetical protein